ncbi:NADPH:quinone oxidoreductase family protein [Nocardia vaccinii]|uniref:NADPH:quinone oxidoreductase family protein n=1 Tax=Nocardia vaccinii TaxID=1822 RepID=UPI0008356DBF|nr:NADPH:quinone oxidoreductase family protein [Nocardia vaccinii]
MRAMQITELTGPAALCARSIPVPIDDDARVIVDVRAVGVNFPDLLMTYGRYQMQVPVPFVPGVEVAGVVAAAPRGCSSKVGDEVVAFCTQLGGYAERVAVDPAMVADKPAELDFGEAAALLANFQTVHFAMTRRVQVRVGQTVLVLGAGGGIGTAAIQIAKMLGAEVIAVVRRTGIADRLVALGADHVVPLTPGWSREVRGLTDGAGVDYVLDPVGGAAFDEAVRTLAVEGHLLVIGFASGEGIPAVKVNRLLLRNVAVDGVAWGEYLVGHPEAFVESVYELRALVANGFRPYISTRFPIAEAAKALGALERGAIVGKAVLELGDANW